MNTSAGMRPRLPSLWRRVIPALVAFVPGVLVNTLLLLTYSARQDRGRVLPGVKVSPFFVGTVACFHASMVIPRVASHFVAWPVCMHERRQLAVLLQSRGNTPNFRLNARVNEDTSAYPIPSATSVTRALFSRSSSHARLSFASRQYA